MPGRSSRFATGCHPALQFTLRYRPADVNKEFRQIIKKQASPEIIALARALRRKLKAKNPSMKFSETNALELLARIGVVLAANRDGA